MNVESLSVKELPAEMIVVFLEEKSCDKWYDTVQFGCVWFVQFC